MFLTLFKAQSIFTAIWHDILIILRNMVGIWTGEMLGSCGKSVLFPWTPGVEDCFLEVPVTILKYLCDNYDFYATFLIFLYFYDTSEIYLVNSKTFPRTSFGFLAIGMMPLISFCITHTYSTLPADCFIPTSPLL